jgi:hypothetical protein
MRHPLLSFAAQAAVRAQDMESTLSR